MLIELYLKNFVIIEEASLEPGNGLTVITGETGAGKSILVGALQLITGGRPGREIVRKGAETAIVRGVFDLPPRPDSPDSNLEDAWEEDVWILERHVSVAGSGKAYFNGRRVNVSTLRSAGELLVDLHGQHEHQSILQVKTHLDLLDAFGGLEARAKQLANLYNDYSAELHRLGDLVDSIASRRERVELLEYQRNEIRNIAPEPGEDALLEKEKALLARQAEISERLSAVSRGLYEGESSVMDNLGSGARELSRISELNDSFELWRVSLEHFVSEISDLSAEIDAFKTSLDTSPERLDEVEDRLIRLKTLKRKYGGSIDSALESLAEIENELSGEWNVDEKRRLLEERVNLFAGELSEMAGHLSEHRREVASRLSVEVTAELAELAMEEAEFHVNIGFTEDENSRFRMKNKPVAYLRRGFDTVEFFITPNRGERAGSLSRIASGGEISRVMLALKKVFSLHDPIPTLMFDEIDAGIGGVTAHRVSECLENLAAARQVVCITHLPVIASRTDTHYRVEKKVSRGRTYSIFRKLDNGERREELARMVGVVEEGDEAAAMAADLFLGADGAKDRPTASEAGEKSRTRAESAE